MALAPRLTAYQAVFLIPSWRCTCGCTVAATALAWAVLFTPAVFIGGWQTFEDRHTGAMPAAVLGGYFKPTDSRR